jgi:protein ImuA
MVPPPRSRRMDENQGQDRSLIYCTKIQYFEEATMLQPAAIPSPESLHPSLWRADQLARATTRCVDTGHATLSAQLPGGGWPMGTLVDLHVQQPGIGEMRLLAPALRQVADRRVVLLQPPHPPQALALAALGLQPSSVIWLRAERTADALWAAEQVLRSASCGALLFWPDQIGNGGRQRTARPEHMRRLHLAAQAGETLFFMMRPLAAAHDASPAPLRLSLRPAHGGIDVGFVKRQGPARDDVLFLPMPFEHVRPAQPRRETVPERVFAAPPMAEVQ